MIDYQYSDAIHSNVQSIYKNIRDSNERYSKYALDVLEHLILKYIEVGKNFYVKSLFLERELPLTSRRIGGALGLLAKMTDEVELYRGKRSGICNLYVTRFKKGKINKMLVPKGED